MADLLVTGIDQGVVDAVAQRASEEHRLVRTRTFSPSCDIVLILRLLRCRHISGLLELVVHDGGIRSIVLRDEYIVLVEK